MRRQDHKRGGDVPGDGRGVHVLGGRPEHRRQQGTAQHRHLRANGDDDVHRGRRDGSGTAAPAGPAASTAAARRDAARPRHGDHRSPPRREGESDGRGDEHRRWSGAGLGGAPAGGRGHIATAPSAGPWFGSPLSPAPRDAGAVLGPGTRAGPVRGRVAGSRGDAGPEQHRQATGKVPRAAVPPARAGRRDDVVALRSGCRAAPARRGGLVPSPRQRPGRGKARLAAQGLQRRPAGALQHRAADVQARRRVRAGPAGAARADVRARARDGA